MVAYDLREIEAVTPFEAPYTYEYIMESHFARINKISIILLLLFSSILIINMTNILVSPSVTTYMRSTRW